MVKKGLVVPGVDRYQVEFDLIIYIGVLEYKIVGTKAEMVFYFLLVTGDVHSGIFAVQAANFASKIGKFKRLRVFLHKPGAERFF
jgi:hypothetical protein